jgi:hypothetical protein
LKWPEQTLKTLKCQTVQEAINSNSSCIAIINRSSSNSALLILTILLTELNLFFNIGKNMNPAQIKMTIDLILGDLELKNLKPEDFKVCFDGIKRGKYGKLYDRLDGQIIIESLYSYSNEKLSIIEQQTIKHSADLKKTDKKEMIPEIVDVLKLAIKEIPEETKKETIKKVHERDPRINELFQEFEKLFKINGIEKGGRFVNYNGKILNQVEFLETKLGESKA